MISSTSLTYFCRSWCVQFGHCRSPLRSRHHVRPVKLSPSSALVALRAHPCASPRRKPNTLVQLTYGNAADPLNGEAAALMTREPERFTARVKEYIARFCQPVAAAGGAGRSPSASDASSAAASTVTTASVAGSIGSSASVAASPASIAGAGKPSGVAAAAAAGSSSSSTSGSGAAGSAGDDDDDDRRSVGSDVSELSDI